MVLIKHAKWIFAAAGSGIAVGFYNYLKSEKSRIQASWTTNFEPSVKWDYNWDKLDPSSAIKPVKTDDPKEQNKINEEKKSLKPNANRHIILISQGQYENTFKDDRDQKLTPLGRKQADYVGKRLKELGFKYASLTRSTMTRAIETSDIILKHFPDLPTEKCDMLREGFPIAPEPPVDSWEPESNFFKDGSRIEAAFRKYFHRASPSQESHSYDIIVCHANVIRYFLCRVLQFPPEAWSRFSVHPGSITWIVLTQSGQVAVITVGDFGFLPREAMLFEQVF